MSNDSLSCTLYSSGKDRWIEDYIQPAVEKNKVEKFEAMLKKTRSQIEKKMAQEKKTEESTEDIHDDPDETETEDSESDYGADDNTSKQPGGSKSKAKNGKKKAVRKGKSTKTKTKPKSQKRSSEEDLIAAIRNKNGRGNPLASIAARYGVASMDDDPLDDSNFEKLRSKYSKK